MTEMIEIITFPLLRLNAFQSHIWMLNTIKYRSLPNFPSYGTISTAQEKTRSNTRGGNWDFMLLVCIHIKKYAITRKCDSFDTGETFSL